MLGTYALSAGYYDAYYLKAQKVRTLIKQDFDALWAQGFDALVAPTSPTVAFPFGTRWRIPVAMYLSDACTLPGQHGGAARRSVPCGLSDGLPVGLQIIGALWSEAPLFALPAGTGDHRRRVVAWPRAGGLRGVDDPATPTPAERRPQSRPTDRQVAIPEFGRGGSRRPSARTPGPGGDHAEIRIALAGQDDGPGGHTVSPFAHWRRTWGVDPTEAVNHSPGMTLCRSRPPSRHGASRSMRPRRESGRGWSRWDSGAAAGTATTSST